MNWIKNNLGFIIIIIGILAFAAINVYKPINTIDEIEQTIGISEEDQSIKVEIKGEIQNPGIYECLHDDRVVDVILLAGGLTVDADVDQINRSEKVEDEMVIMIPRITQGLDDNVNLLRYIQVEIKGEVNEPGIYKCPEHSILMDLVTLAGGLTYNADASELNLAQKLAEGKSYIVESVNEDMIYVEVKGAIHFPGVYQFKEGDMIHDLIVAAGGFLDSADTSDISLVQELEDHQLIIIEENITFELEKAVDLKGAVNNPGVYYFESGDRLIDVIQKAGGFLPIADCRNINFSLLLEDEDLIFIPEIKEDDLLAVDVKGEVKYPGVYYLREGSRVIDAIVMAGGFRPEANTSKINLSNLLDDQDMISIPKIDLDEAYIYVEIIGEVFLPGIYAMKPESRVIMLINQAGGFTSEAYQDDINLTRVLSDEEVIIVSNMNEMNQEIDDDVEDDNDNDDSDSIDDVTEDEGQTIFVRIIGEVYLPGNYEVKDDISMIDLIHLAGGLTIRADINGINFNQEILHGTVVVIPSVEDEIPTLPSEIEGLVNINVATSEQLQTLDGIGIILAERIIQYRIDEGPFLSIEDIMNVSGIGDSIYDKIKDDITV